MAHVEFKKVDIGWNSDPDKNGTIQGSCSFSFSTNIIDATAAIQSFWIESCSEHEIRVVGASIESVEYNQNSTTVDIEASITYRDDDDHYINRDNSTMSIVIIAWCE